MKAIILAAGKGTRLGTLTKDTPKPLIKVAGKPIVQHIMEGMRETGIKDFTLITRYLAEKIENYFADGSDLGINITYVRQPEDKYGTAAALMAAEGSIDPNASIMLGWGDIITTQKTYSAVVELFKKGDCDGVMSLNYMDDPSAGGAVYTNEDGTQVAKVVEKQPKGDGTSHWNSAGIFVFKPVIFDYLKKLQPSARGEYEISDTINMMIDNGLVIRPHYLKGIWCDIGRPEDIKTAEEILKKE